MHRITCGKSIDGVALLTLDCGQKQRLSYVDKRFCGIRKVSDDGSRTVTVCSVRVFNSRAFAVADTGIFKRAPRYVKQPVDERVQRFIGRLETANKAAGIRQADPFIEQTAAGTAPAGLRSRRNGGTPVSKDIPELIGRMSARQ